MIFNIDAFLKVLLAIGVLIVADEARAEYQIIDPRGVGVESETIETMNSQGIANDSTSFVFSGVAAQTSQSPAPNLNIENPVGLPEIIDEEECETISSFRTFVSDHDYRAGCELFTDVCHTMPDHEPAFALASAALNSQQWILSLDSSYQLDCTEPEIIQAVWGINPTTWRGRVWCTYTQTVCS